MRITSRKTLLTCAALIAALAATGALAQKFVLSENYESQSLIDGFNFVTYDDPTHGFVDYVDKDEAQALGLYSINAAQQVILKPDTDNIVQQGQRGRKSVRLESIRKYRGGLFIFDAVHTPQGCGTWPAYWACGDNWPNNGEIDIIEGVNDQTVNFMTLHTRDGCQMSGVPVDDFTGEWAINDGHAATNCYVYAPDQFANQGCSIHGGQYGSAFNAAGGGVIATYWDADSFIKVWNFPRAQIPRDIQDGRPDPSQWGEPVALFEFGSACSPDHFNDMSLIINLTFCGDWAGNTFAQDCPGIGQSCRDYVAYNPKAFDQAYWRINYLRVYVRSSGVEEVERV